MIQDPLVSIIVPVYNAALYLHISIPSVLQQTYSNWELILIDDGSTDDSLAICRHYEKLDNRISVYTKVNGGQGSARNLGLSKAKGSYIAFLDSDDAFSPDVLQANMPYFEQYPDIKLLQFPIYMQYESATQYVLQHDAQLIAHDLYQYWLDQSIISWIVCNKIFSKELIAGLRFNESIIYEDNYFIVDVMQKIKAIFISDKGLYYYYSRQQSTTTSQYSLKKEQDTLCVLQHLLTTLDRDKYPQLYLKMLVRIINIEKAIKVNFKEKIRGSAAYTSKINWLSILSSKLPVKDKIKLLIAKTI